MIEQIIIDYLTEAQTLPVYAETPVNAEDEYIVIERIGGSEVNMIREATVVVQTITNVSLYRAAQLAEQIRVLMLDLVELNSVFHCSVNAGPYNYTDTSTKNYRYQTVYTINY